MSASARSNAPAASRPVANSLTAAAAATTTSASQERKRTALLAFDPLPVSSKKPRHDAPAGTTSTNPSVSMRLQLDDIGSIIPTGTIATMRHQIRSICSTLHTERQLQHVLLAAKAAAQMKKNTLPQANTPPPAAAPAAAAAAPILSPAQLAAAASAQQLAVPALAVPPAAAAAAAAPAADVAVVIPTVIERPQICTVRIKLSPSKPPIWRDVDVPLTLSLKDLHKTIMCIMNWSGDHLWEFAAGKSRYNDSRFNEFDGFEAPALSAKRTRLEDLLSLNPILKLKYLYDFGANWQFDLQFSDLRAGAAIGLVYPHVIRGRKNAPIEDYCPDDDEDMELHYDPNLCDVPAMNQRILKAIERKWITTHF